LPAAGSAGAGGYRERAGREPANDRERALSEVVAAALGLAGVDVEADFFALGGDSIVAMRLVGRARAAGLRITPRQVFAERTVAGLALVATALDPAGSPAADGVGSFPLTPVMRWLSEVEGPIDGFNQSAVVQVPAGLGWAPLLAALQAVTDRHDLLRARLDRTGDWSIVVPPVSLRAADFTVRVDVAGFDERGLWDAVAERARIAQAALDPDRGVMIRAAWLDQAQVVAERPGDQLDAGQHEIGRAAPGRGQVDDVAEQRRGDQAGDGARDHQEHRAGQAAPQRPDQDLQLGAGPPAARGRQQRRSAHARTVSR
jgi:aryl carrier-like protein